MSAVGPALACLLVYFLGYRFYARYLARRVFELDPARRTPAHERQDGIDFLPTSRAVLFGHHFASITGLSPMLGPAIAVIWGWLPAMVWVVLGAVLIGCVHDFAALVLSIRAGGQSIGKIAEGVIGRRAKALFFAFIFFGVALAMGVFTLVIAALFAGGYGSAVLPSGGLMLVAALVGYLTYRRGASMAPLAVAGLVIQLVLVWAGHRWPIEWASADGWSWVLLAYAFLASVLPVWSLLQPRDFLNSLLLYLGLGLCYVGFFVWSPDFAAPAFDPDPRGAPSFFPFVFITIACGAASGFHALVSSGTTAKQLDRETDAVPIGYGAMIGESLLGLLAVLASTAGLRAASSADAARLWSEHYHDWAHADGLAAKMTSFIDGAAEFVAELGIDHGLAAAFIAVVVVSFALTTLDSATRLLRYNVEEIGASIGVGALGNRFVSSTIAVCAIAFFAFYRIDGRPAGAVLWTIFGTVNQLLAGLTLLVATLYLRRRGRAWWWTGAPMVFMLATTGFAMFENLVEFSNGFRFRSDENGVVPWELLIVALALMALSIWLLVEVVCVMRRREPRTERLEVF